MDSNLKVLWKLLHIVTPIEYDTKYSVWASTSKTFWVSVYFMSAPSLGLVTKWPKRQVKTDCRWTIHPVSVTVRAACRVSRLILNTRHFFTRIPSLPCHVTPRKQGWRDLPPTAVTRFKTVNEAGFFRVARSGMTPGADFERGGGLRVTWFRLKASPHANRLTAAGLGTGPWLRCANKKKISLVKCSWIITQKTRRTMKPQQVISWFIIQNVFEWWRVKTNKYRVFMSPLKNFGIFFSMSKEVSKLMQVQPLSFSFYQPVSECIL